MILDEFAKAILGFLPLAGTASVRAITYNLELTGDEAHRGVYALMAQGLVDQTRHETYFLTSDGVAFRAREQAVLA